MNVQSILRVLTMGWAVVATCAQATLTVDGPPTHTLTVTPASAPAMTPRTIHLVVWGSGCAPGPARLETGKVNEHRVLLVVVNPPSSGPCTLQAVQYSFDLTYTPQNEGDLRVMAVYAGGAWLTEGVLVTRDQPTRRSKFDLTGMWYDPATSGSGLTFVHAQPRNDAVFGTWFLYDAQRNPRWYTIQNVFWHPGGQEAEGILFAASAPINICPLTVIGCPTAASLFAPMARARIVLHSASAARVDALRADGSVIFSSNVVRAPI